MDAAQKAKRCALALAALILASIDAGCVKRRYTIRTDPPGALVYVNGEEVGTSPVSKSYTYYGAREIVVVADGYATEKIIQPFDAPWWDNGLTDFFTENLLPVTLRDEREFDYRLVPSVNPSPNEVLTRGQALKQRAQMPLPPPRRSFWQWIGLSPTTSF